MKLKHVAIAALLVALAGCGGGSGSNSAISPFAGAFSGTFTLNDASGASNGHTALSVGNDGHFTGNNHNDTFNTDGTESGSIDSSGNLTITIIGVGGTGTGTGTVSKNANNHLVGTIQEFSGNTLVGTITIDVIKQ